MNVNIQIYDFGNAENPDFLLVHRAWKKGVWLSSSYDKTDIVVYGGVYANGRNQKATYCQRWSLDVSY